MAVNQNYGLKLKNHYHTSDRRETDKHWSRYRLNCFSDVSEKCFGNAELDKPTTVLNIILVKKYSKPEWKWWTFATMRLDQWNYFRLAKNCTRKFNRWTNDKETNIWNHVAIQFGVRGRHGKVKGITAKLVS